MMHTDLYSLRPSSPICYPSSTASNAPTLALLLRAAHHSGRSLHLHLRDGDVGEGGCCTVMEVGCASLGVDQTPSLRAEGMGCTQRAKER